MFKFWKSTLTLLAAFPLLCFQPFVHADSKPFIILTVKASPDSALESRLALQENNQFASLFEQAKYKKAQTIPVTDALLTVQSDQGSSTYLVDSNGNLYSETTNDMIELQYERKELLAKSIRMLRSVHYGEMMSWEHVKTLIPRKLIFKVIDLETGLSFNVQRRAGKNHADVQPLSKEDTAVMKRIYNGKWSWDRKAILVQTGNHELAASMHGMPHGGDGIPDNNFRGHFCIHFRDSATHRSGNVDPEHQLMVLKAGGQLEPFFNHASPYDIINTFFIAFNMREPQILKMSFSHAKHQQLPFFLENSECLLIRHKLNHQPENASDLLSLDIPVEVRIYYKDKSVDRAVYTFQMKRTSLTAPWKIDIISMIS